MAFHRGIDLCDLVPDSGVADLQSFDFTQPAFLFGFDDAGLEVVADFGEHLFVVHGTFLFRWRAPCMPCACFGDPVKWIVKRAQKEIKSASDCVARLVSGCGV